MTKAVLDAEGESDVQRACASAPTPVVAVPASLQASLLSRLDRLGPAKDVAQVGAAIGREFPHLLLAALVHKPEAELDADLDRLMAAGLLFRRGIPPHASYLFKHALVQDAAYGTLLREPRRALHARIAEALESHFADVAENQPELLAHHYSRAGELEKAFHFWPWVVSTACTSSAKPLATAQRLIAADLADACVVGGIDTLCSMTLRGFFSLDSLSPAACKPFNKKRDGINIGEGGALLVLEKGGDAIALLEAVGESSDAYHISAPHPEGVGARLAMQRALKLAHVEPGKVDYVNAHGTGTRLNDSAEAQAIGSLLGREVPVVSTKGYTGHMLGDLSLHLLNCLSISFDNWFSDKVFVIVLPFVSFSD